MSSKMQGKYSAGY